MFVSVVYYKEAPINGFAGAKYTYETHLPLKEGDKVAAPVKNRKMGCYDDKKALVIDVDIPKPDFPCSVITQMWSEVEA